jgi:L-fuconolactonase
MRVDAHVHFWNYRETEYAWIDASMKQLRRDFLPKDFHVEMGRLGLQGCIAVQARQSLEETKWLLTLAAEFPFILGVVGWIDLRARDVQTQLASFANRSKLVGIRHVVQDEPDDFLLRPDFLRGVAALADSDLTYDILIYPSQLANAARFVERLPSQRFVLDHLAKPPIKSGEIRDWADGLRRLAQFPNVVSKVSGLATEADWQHWNEDQFIPYLDIAFDCFGPHRLMAGSDWPVCTLVANYERALATTQLYLGRFSNSDRDAVLGETAARFWRLKSPSQSSVAKYSSEQTGS